MKIAVACGGVSPEREVSLRSGAAVAEALAKAGHSTTVEDVKVPSEFLNKMVKEKPDIVFIALHGGWGEDGRFQSALEAFGLPYTGPGPMACGLAMDKVRAKIVLEGAGVKVPYGIIRRKGDGIDGLSRAMVERYGKVVVKPNGGGSTVGVTIASDKNELKEGLEEAWAQEERALVEEYIPGFEATVALVAGDDETIALPPIHISPKAGFYDYKNKYTGGCTKYICPADFPSDVTENLKAAAIASHNALGCEVYSRADFRVTDEGDVVALEVNTAPGMTELSLVPMAAAEYGLDFPEFLDRIVNLSLKVDRHFKI